MVSYKLTVDAKADLQRIYYYGFDNWGEKQADKYFNAFFERFEEIAKNPNLYQSIDHIREGYRCCICGVDSIYYRVIDDVVEIVNILGSQNLDDNL